MKGLAVAASFALAANTSAFQPDFLACDETNGSLVLTPKSDDKGFTWLVEPGADGGFCFLSGSFVLSVDVSTGSLAMCYGNDADIVATSETGIPEPLLPDNRSRSKVLKWVGLGAIPVVAAVAGPYLVMGAVGAMGFGTTGIASGSMAAAMMSAQATTLGGGIAAGGIVATLQSIGVAGLGAVGMTASLSGGAIVGGGIAVATSKVVLQDEEAEGQTAECSPNTEGVVNESSTTSVETPS